MEMSEQQNPSDSLSEKEHSFFSAECLRRQSDERFLHCLTEFVEQEKVYLQAPGESPAELRYIIHRSVFNKLIAQAKACKRLLLTIKMGYDDVIRMLQIREDEARTSQPSLGASASHPKPLVTRQRRACELQRETAELQAYAERQRRSEEQEAWIPGWTVEPEALDEHLKHLEEQRAALLDRKSHCVCVEVKAEPDAELQAAERHREQLSLENEWLKVLNGRLRFVSDRLSNWEDEKHQVAVEEVLSSTLSSFRYTSVKDAELFEDEEETRGTDYLHRFMELFDSAQYEEAALLAARSPGGVLRNLDTMKLFKGVKEPPGSVSPLLLFVQALLMTLPAGDKLSAALSLQVARCALQHGASQLIAHAVTHNKMTFSEDLGDILTEHAQKNLVVADLCLTLATDIYEACGLDRKRALSMCRRGLIHGAAELLNHSQDLSAEDCMWVLCRSPSLALLQLLTEHRRDQTAILSVGVACSHLLADPQQQELAVQLLDSFVSRGRGVLEKVIVEDSSSSVDIWTDIMSLCSELNRADLSLAILCVLLDQSGTSVLSPDLQGARLMEHVFL